MSFIKTIAPFAQKLSKEYGVLASLIIAQACHESRYGESGLAKKAFNLFGIKGTYNGQAIQMPTWEHYNGKDVTVLANFRKYPSYLESMEDLCKLYVNGVSWDRNKYRGAIDQKDFEKAARAVESAGYATDPYGYANKLLGIYKQANLGQYDTVDGKTPYYVIVPNTAFWQAKALVAAYEKKGYKCQGVSDKVYGPDEKPQKDDPYQFYIHTDLDTAKKLVIELKHKGYSKTFGRSK
ncbi:glycoside hydrolase family 73 protein [Robertmurraya korlensis]|uniref:glycoside hydrolase family 73 protein n=1 Tax=Robertmurraya korlensis TaxID=519977 RepID=UPI002040597D|nr:glycoside hydrolase family 73 protein [Robertmurraya korlensis]MCM3600620.1 glycoside hydrolase family 73 protein [Robertmurraya korlensis]